VIVFFAMEWLPVDVITLSIVIALVISGVLTPGEAFSGLANDMVIVLASVFVLSGAMVKSSLMDGLGRFNMQAVDDARDLLNRGNTLQRQLLRRDARNLAFDG
jgi:di/tricarboxylate transporter